MKKTHPNPQSCVVDCFLILYPLSPLACLRWQQQQHRFCVLGLCFPGVTGASLGQARFPFLSLLGRKACTMGVPTGPCLGFSLPLRFLALSLAPSGLCGCDATHVTRSRLHKTPPSRLPREELSGTVPSGPWLCSGLPPSPVPHPRVVPLPGGM